MYVDRPTRSKRTYPGRSLVIGVQIVLIFAIAHFGILSLETMFSRLAPAATPQADTVYTPLTPHNDCDVSAYYASVSPNEWNNMAEACLDEDDFAGAVTAYNNLFRLVPDAQLNAAFNLNRGVANEYVGNEQATSNDFATYISKMHRNIIINYDYEVGQTSRMYQRAQSVSYYMFRGETGDTFNFSAIAEVTDSVDPLILVLNSEREPLVSQDDTIASDGTLINMDSAIFDYTLSEPCTPCILAVTHAGASSSREYHIPLEGIVNVRIEQVR